MDAHGQRARLEAEWTRLLEVRRGLDEELPQDSDTEGGPELSALDQHQADAASDLFEREMDLSILARVEADLREVVYAMGRLDEGTYGRCETCGHRIPDDRLEAVPATRFCIEHEQQWEGRSTTTPVDGAAFAGSVAAREAAEHFEFLPTDDDEGEVEIGPEEAAMHSTEPARGGGGSALRPHEVEQVEEHESERDDEERTGAARRAVIDLTEADEAAMEDDQLGPARS